jgi:hypothetical protein
MATMVTVAEATKESTYTHEHITWLVREGKIKGRKAGRVWLLELESLKEYETKMTELGNLKHNPTHSLEQYPR